MQGNLTSFLFQEKSFSIIKDHIHGVPDLVVEVLSGDRNYDLKIKKADIQDATGFMFRNNVYHELSKSSSKLSSLLLNTTFEF